ncbi:hypothetical protein AVEN_6975-1 [Araneus ventricosus]|uniref:Uncharacterized protein n=1 Tax=Araneus ventricosus TaxID=182803 RepID=A0A4Y2L4I7_ARAVE|nr:hypothetical protein AVEN_6975-1 [Araneus ventricosus]
MYGARCLNHRRGQTSLLLKPGAEVEEEVYLTVVKITRPVPNSPRVASKQDVNITKLNNIIYPDAKAGQRGSSSLQFATDRGSLALGRMAYEETSRLSCYEDVLNRLLLSLDPVLTGMRPTMRKKSKSFLKETLDMLLPMEFSEVLDEEDSDHEETENGINDLSSDE